MKLNLNGIEIDWVKYIPRNFTADTTKHTIIGNGTNIPEITSNIKIRNIKHSLQCLIKDKVFNKDKNIRYNELLKLATDKQIIKMSTKLSIFMLLSSADINGDYVITQITENEIGNNFIKFTIVLEQVFFSSVKVIETGVTAKDLSVSSKLKETTQKGVQDQLISNIQVPTDYKELMI